MPVANLEQLKEKEASLKKALGELGESADAAKRRVAGKKLRRTQRKRRLAVVAAEKLAVKSKKAAEETKAEAGAATQATTGAPEGEQEAKEE